MIAKIYILPKKEILDPKGKAIYNSLKSLGFNEVEDVRFGKYMEIRINDISKEEVQDRIKEMCNKLLANNIIEDYRFDIEI
jgi:phosphoribosylformylglycinamidine synthase